MVSVTAQVQSTRVLMLEKLLLNPTIMKQPHHMQRLVTVRSVKLLWHPMAASLMLPARTPRHMPQLLQKFQLPTDKVIF
jgi:hypothetical protein